MADDAVEIEETAEHLAGWFHNEYVVAHCVVDSVRRRYSVFELYDMDNPTELLYAYVPLPSVPKREAEFVMNNTLRVLKKVSGRSRHFPRLKHYGLIKRLVFGLEGDTDMERDPDWVRRPYIIVNHEHVGLAHLAALAPTLALPLELVMHAALGMTYCLAALHRAGFVHRLVSPHSFSYPAIVTLDTLSTRMLLTDLSLCQEYPVKPRTVVPFMGCLRYASLRVHLGREQGPADDYIALVYVVAEMLSGKLPWRSIFDAKVVEQAKAEFWQTTEFRRLPKEVRSLYKRLLGMPSIAWVDPKIVVDTFKAVLTRKDPSKNYELPKWLIMPSAN